MSRSVLGHGFKCTAVAGYVDECSCKDLGNERVECDWCGKEIDLDETVVVWNHEDYHSGCYAEYRKSELDVENLCESDLVEVPPLYEVLEDVVAAIERTAGREVV